MALFEAFLAQRGLISVQHLAHALEQSDSAQPPLSAVALRGGFLSVKQVAAVRAYCHSSGNTFEQAVTDLDYLDAKGIRSTIELQLSMSRPALEWLVAQKLLSPERLSVLQQEFYSAYRSRHIDEARLAVLDRRANRPLTRALQQLQLLKPFPDSANQVVKLLRQDDFQLEAVLKLFEQNPTLTGRLLELVNSSLFSTGAPCVSIVGALTRLGARKLRDIVYSLAFFGLFDALTEETEECRAHSVGVAAIARALAVHTPGANRDLAFLTGLMHDIGKLVLQKASLNPPEAAWAPRSHHQHRLSQANDDNEERDRLGFDHSLLSVLALRAWGFPDICCEIVADHHSRTPGHSRAQVGRQILAVADALEHTMVAGGSGEHVRAQEALPSALQGWTPGRLGDFFPLLEEARNDSLGALRR